MFKETFKPYPIGYFHIDIAEVQTAEGKLYLYVAIDHAHVRRHENGIAHRLTKIKHPWTNGQVERMNRTIKEATVKRYHYDRHEQLESHLADFINAYNYGRRLKNLKGLSPYEFIVKAWTKEPERFRVNPTHQMPD